MFLNVKYLDRNEEPRLHREADGKMYTNNGSPVREVQTLYGEALFEDQDGLIYKSDGTLASNRNREKSKEVMANFLTKNAETYGAHSKNRFFSKAGTKCGSRKVPKSCPARAQFVEKWKSSADRDTKSATAKLTS